MGDRGVRESTLRDIEKAIDEIYLENPAGFKLVQSEIHRRSGISRPTLGKSCVQEHIHSYVSRLPKAYRLISDQKSREGAENRRLRETCERLKSEKRALLAQFNALFDRIYGDSVDVRTLVNLRDSTAVDDSE